MRLIVVAVLVIVALAAGGLFYAKKKAEHDAHVAALKSQWDGFTAELRRDSDDYHAVANATGAYFAAVEDFGAKFTAVQDPAGLAIALDRLDTWADKKRANDAVLMRFLDRDFRPRDMDNFSRDTAKYLNASFAACHERSPETIAHSASRLLAVHRRDRTQRAALIVCALASWPRHTRGRSACD
jgi:hypothetical protein